MQIMAAIDMCMIDTKYIIIITWSLGLFLNYSDWFLECVISKRNSTKCCTDDESGQHTKNCTSAQ